MDTILNVEPVSYTHLIPEDLNDLVFPEDVKVIEENVSEEKQDTENVSD